MRQETMKILFFIKKGSLLKNGQAPIVVRVTFNGVCDEARIQRSVEPRLWNQTKGCCKGKDRVCAEINDYIESIRARLHGLYKNLLLEEALITPSGLISTLFNKEEKRRTLLSTMKSGIEDMESRVGIDYENVTINRYWNCFRCVEACVKTFYKKDDIVYSELTSDFIKYLDKYFRVEKRLCQNTIVRYMKCFKKFVNEAIASGLMKANPFVGIKYRQEETAPTFLTMDEIKSIAEADFPLARLDVVRDMFLFSCFTGLAFIDAKELRYTDLFKDNNGKLWIRKSRHKIKKDKARCISNIPLLPAAIAIIEKYKKHPSCLEKGVCLPLFCNQTMNSYLKQIAVLCNIDKNLTTHVARHTFATTITLANNVSLANVAKMMGHSSTRMTEHYARVLDQTIMNDMEKVSKTLSGVI